MTKALILLLAFCNLQSLQAQAQPVRLPAKPTPAPTPVTQDEVQPLNGDEIYVIDSDVPLIIKQFPKGRLLVEEDSGPIKIKGRFIYGGGKKETKTFNGKHVYQLTGITDGRVDVIGIPGVVKSNDSLIEFTLQVATGTDPPKPPIPPKPPEPETTNPFTDEAFHVLMIYKTAVPLPAAQISAMNGAAIETYIKSKGDFRIYPDTETGEHDTEVYKTAAKREKKSLPWVIIGKGKYGYEGPLPANATDMLALLKKYGG